MSHLLEFKTNNHRSVVLNIAHRSQGRVTLLISLLLIPLLSLQQAWSSRGQQLLVPAAWQQMTSVAPPPSHPLPPPPSLHSNDAANGQQRLSDWGWVIIFTIRFEARLFSQ